MFLFPKLTRGRTRSRSGDTKKKSTSRSISPLIPLSAESYPPERAHTRPGLRTQTLTLPPRTPRKSTPRKSIYREITLALTTPDNRYTQLLEVDDVFAESSSPGPPQNNAKAYLSLGRSPSMERLRPRSRSSHRTESYTAPAPRKTAYYIPAPHEQYALDWDAYGASGRYDGASEIIVETPRRGRGRGRSSYSEYAPSQTYSYSPSHTYSHSYSHPPSPSPSYGYSASPSPSPRPRGIRSTSISSTAPSLVSDADSSSTASNSSGSFSPPTVSVCSGGFSTSPTPRYSGQSSSPCSARCFAQRSSSKASSSRSSSTTGFSSSASVISSASSQSSTPTQRVVQRDSIPSRRHSFAGRTRDRSYSRPRPASRLADIEESSWV